MPAIRAVSATNVLQLGPGKSQVGVEICDGRSGLLGAVLRDGLKARSAGPSAPTPVAPVPSMMVSVARSQSAPIFSPAPATAAPAASMAPWALPIGPESLIFQAQDRGELVDVHRFSASRASRVRQVRR